MSSSTDAAAMTSATDAVARVVAGVRGAGLAVTSLDVAFRGRPGRARARTGAGGEPAVLADVSLGVRPGGLLAVLGPSGCGKSTMLRVIAGLPAPGAVVGPRARIDVPRTAAGAPDVAWMPQSDALLPWRRTLANVALGARLAGASRARATAEAAELLRRFGLAGCERAWPHELSGGMRQRAALARTVLARRAVLLLDEPFGALDALTRRSMTGWLAAQRSGGGLGDGTAVVLVTHDVDEAVALADDVVVLAGRPARVVARVDVEDVGRAAARRVVLASLDDR